MFIRHLRSVTTVFLLALLLIASTAYGADEKKQSSGARSASEDELRGKWTGIEHYFDGKPWPGLPSAFRVFQGGKAYQLVVANGRPTHFITTYDRYHVHPTKTPKQLDLTWLNPSALWPGREHIAGTIWKCLYELRGDKLTLCYRDHVEAVAQKEADGKSYKELTRPSALSSANGVTCGFSSA